MAVRHRRADLDGGLQVKLLIASGGATITRATGPAFQDADITSVKNGTGDYTVTINPFKGPAGEIYVNTTALHATLKLYTVIKSITYTNDSVAINILAFDEGGTAQEAAIFVNAYAE